METSARTSYLNSIISAYSPDKDSFTDLNVSCQLDLAVKKAAYSEPLRSERAIADWRDGAHGYSVIQALRTLSGDHVLLKGRPGSGKTSTLRRLLLEQALEAHSDSTMAVPVLVELRYYKTSTLSLIRDCFLSQGMWYSDDQQIERLLVYGQLSLLFDGLNELSSRHAMAELEHFRKTHCRTPMVFSSRDFAVGGNLGIGAILEIEPLSEDQIHTFVEKYLPDKVAEFLFGLRERQLDFQDTPLFLHMLCVLFREHNQIPENLGEIFRRFVSDYTERKIYHASVCAEYVSYAQELLSELAFEMMEGDDPTSPRLAIAREKVEKIFTAFLEERSLSEPGALAAKLVDDLIKYHLIQLTSSASDESFREREIAFAHQMVQEYFASERLLKRLPDLRNDEFQYRYLNYLKWTEPIALMLGILDDEEQTLRVVQLAFQVDYVLGARFAGAAKTDFQSKTIAVIKKLELPQPVKIRLLGKTRSAVAVGELKHYLTDDSPQIRYHAVKSLGMIPCEKAASALTRPLAKEETYIRKETVWALAGIPSHTSMETLIAVISQDDDSDVRRWATFALRRFPIDRTIASLISSLADSAPIVRREALFVLGDFRCEQAVDAITDLLTDPDISIRRSAAESLLAIGLPKALDALAGALDDKDSIVRKSAIDALGAIGTERAVEELHAAIQDEHFGDSLLCIAVIQALSHIRTENAVDAVMESLKSPDLEVARAAAIALAKLAPKRATDTLLEMIRGSFPTQRKNAIYCLGYFREPEVITALLTAIGETGESAAHIRRFAVSSLAKIACETDVERVSEPLLADETADFQPATALLGEREYNRIVDGLISALTHQDSEVGCRAAIALGNLRVERAVDFLVDKFRDPHWDDRWSALYALARIGGGTEVRMFVDALDEEDLFIREQATVALGRIGSEIAVTALLGVLTGKVGEGRKNAAKALGRIRSEKAIHALAQALRDPDIPLRRESVKALATINSEFAAQALIYALGDKDSYVRQVAARTLGSIGSKQAIETLVASCQDPDRHVSEVSVHALAEIGSERCIASLVDKLHGDNQHLWEGALTALASLDSDMAVQAVATTLATNEKQLFRGVALTIGSRGTSRLLKLLLSKLPAIENPNILLAIMGIQRRLRYYHPDYTEVEIKPGASSLVHDDHEDQFIILHFSDLHFRRDEDAVNLFAALKVDLRDDLGLTTIHCVVISGDISDKCSDAGYRAAEAFLRYLRQMYDLPSNRIVIVPGNHDLNRSVSKRSYKWKWKWWPRKPETGDRCIESRFWIGERQEHEYRQRFSRFSQFYEAISGEPYPLDYNSQGTWYDMPASRLMILGLNSAWSIDHHYDKRASIKQEALTHALKARDDKARSCRKIAVWHHPPYGTATVQLDNSRFLGLLAQAGFRLALVGHIHEADQHLYQLDVIPEGRKLNIVSGGTFAGSPEVGHGWHYNVVTITGKACKIDARIRRSQEGAWGPDARFLQGSGAEPKASFEFYL